MKITRREMFAMLGAAALRAESPATTIYIGTYTRGKSKGIYRCSYQAADGTLGSPELAAQTENPSWLALHPNRRCLYAVNEVQTYEGKAAGSVSAFSLDKTGGELKFLNRVSSLGTSPCHVAVEPAGRCVTVANYSSGSVAIFPVHKNGSLGEVSDFVAHTGSSINKKRQSSPHAHETVISKDGRWVFVPDLGADRVMIYGLDAAQGKFSSRRAVKVEPGFGPRHIAFHPNGKFAYLIGEMGGAVIAFHYDAANASLQSFQTISTLPQGFKGANGSAEVHVHPNGKFLYASNRGPDTIAIFAIDGSSGRLRRAGQVSTGGKTPRNFVIDAAGKFLLAENQDSDSIVRFRIESNGMLTPLGQVECGAPVCIIFS